MGVRDFDVRYQPPTALEQEQAYAFMQLVTPFIPVVGQVQSAYEAIMNKELWTGKPLSAVERGMAVVGMLGGIVTLASKAREFARIEKAATEAYDAAVAIEKQAKQAHDAAYATVLATSGPDKAARALELFDSYDHLKDVAAPLAREAREYLAEVRVWRAYDEVGRTLNVAVGAAEALDAAAKSWAIIAFLGAVVKPFSPPEDRDGSSGELLVCYPDTEFEPGQSWIPLGVKQDAVAQPDVNPPGDPGADRPNDDKDAFPVDDQAKDLQLDGNLQQDFDPIQNFTPQQDFDPIQNLTPQQDFDPIQNFTPQQDFDPIQNLTPQQDFDPAQNLTPQQDFDPAQNFTPQQDFDPAQNLTPQQDFDPAQNFTPQQDFDPAQNFTPQQDFDPAQNFTPQQDFDPAQNFTPNVTPQGDDVGNAQTQRDNFDATQVFTPNQNQNQNFGQR